MSQLNRLFNVGNRAQGTYKKVLCVCSAGLLRSPTAALVLSQPPFDYNTRAAGIEESYALVPVDDVLIAWADEIVCMTRQHAAILQALFPAVADKKVVILDIPDDYEYRDPDLIRLIAERYRAA